jgi:TnpA family transposase
MPRIRNWRDLVCYRPAEEATSAHIDPLFRDTSAWELLETPWHDRLRVVLSLKAGTVSASMRLRKLGHYSHKNRLYQAFRALGGVVRTVFLLRYIADLKLREQLTASTNKVEAYNGFAKWLFFAGSGVIADNDAEEQEKAITSNDVVANAVIFQNVVDQTAILRALMDEGDPVAREDLAALSPYVTGHIKRFGAYVIDLEAAPQPLDGALTL